MLVELAGGVDVAMVNVGMRRGKVRVLWRRKERGDGKLRGGQRWAEWVLANFYMATEVGT